MMRLFSKWKQSRSLERALRESEEKFRGLYTDSSDAIMLLENFRFIDCNQATLRLYRVNSLDEFRQLHPADLSPPQQPNGIDSPTMADEMMGIALRNGSHRFDWVHRCADGVDFPAEVLLSVVRFEGREVLQAIVRDVTRRRESEERLRANEEKLRSISEAALDAVIMMDPDGRTVHWNPAATRIFGYAADEVMGGNIHELLTPSNLRETASTALAHFLRTGEGRAVGRIIELRALRKGGEEFPIEISLAPIRIDDSWGAVAVIRDITDRKLAEEKLRAEQRTLRRLLKAHDQERKLIAYEIHDGLAQQLVAAIMQCQAATHDPTTAPDLADQLLGPLRQCLSETRRLIAGVRPPVLDELGVVSAIQTLIDEMPLQGGPAIEFRHELAEERLDPVVENSIYRVIQESLGNACRHSGSDRVAIELREEFEKVLIRIQDWGIGFDPENIDRGRFGIAGLKERARLLGGNVTIDSQPNKGTTIDVELLAKPGELSD